MSAENRAGLLAIDVGTSRVKLGWYSNASESDSQQPIHLPIASQRLPEPMQTFDCVHRAQSKLEFAETLSAWLAQFVDDKPQAVVASVNPQSLILVLDTLKACEFMETRVLQVEELPIQTAVNEPARLGIDRALAAMAVNRLRDTGIPAIVISLGTACTVNFISAEGTFQGGAILPGLAMSGQALYAGTSSLPKILPEGLQLPGAAIGKNTVEAVSAGIYWGLVGGIEKLIREQSRSLAIKPQLFLTGGDAPQIIDALKSSGHAMQFIPHLVLAGIVIACEAHT